MCVCVYVCGVEQSLDFNKKVNTPFITIGNVNLFP
jgi:hypothetical protein